MKKSAGWSLGELFIPALGFLLAIYYLYTIKGLALLAQFYGGVLSFFCIFLFLASVFMFWRTGRKNYDVASSFERLKNLFSKHFKFVWMSALIALFIVAIPLIGYPAACFIFVFVVAALLKYGSFLNIAKASILVTAIGFVLFILFLKVDLPWGI